ncbi:S-adenosylmethionine:tRNA ribosyltransferase-isomerase [Niabella beijingensis]|uniref:S-adenosylmethionine:tRNA ribosyltransferase-isomerase n=1 Tax=Niabella beijingensis TaxID=2872700 RepID=UPI001CBC3DC3|nr:S-adenosylmethionine:tRNA ribosyltransferase-isomerase [Niabella beijingensis]MBZ4190319.1 S-adenosylmethionine:tRNA ribosyltransferase-isomerase [Niabella beijingensis]
MHPKDLNIADFAYELPEEKIAFFPLPERDQSKLLLYKNGQLSEDTYQQIDRHLPEGALAIFNNTKVVEARLLFKKPTGGVIEIFCLEPSESYADITTAMAQQGKVLWLCMVGGAAKWKEGQVLTCAVEGALLEARLMEKRTDSFLIELSWTPEAWSFAEILHLTGQIPLPPYIKRNAEKEDLERYQTVYAAHDGSVAAPTAGLHFTKEVLQKLTQKNIQTDFVTLHVGAGTFKPVKAAVMKDHEMHAEFFSVPAALIQKIIAQQQPLIAVGTTSLRTLESLYWLGAKLLQDKNCFGNDLPQLRQWEPYELPLQHYPVADALRALLDYLAERQFTTLVAKTQIIIAPGYFFKIADALVTNFHQPSSTLLLLVAAFIGDDWKRVYDYALQHQFRFLSYGDGSLLWRTR